MAEFATHPAATDGSIRLVEHSILDACERLGADVFSLVDRDVTFSRKARADSPAQRWNGTLGDWLVPTSTGGWTIVPDTPVTDRRASVDPTAAPAARPKPLAPSA